MPQDYRKSGIRGQRLICLFMLGVVLFNFPILAVFNSSSTLFGIPILFVYLFAAWAGIIVLIYLVIDRTS